MLPIFSQTKFIEAGCDEAGRGCYAGAVFAAAVILPNNFVCETINDSKKITPKKREELRKIIEDNAISFAVASVSNDEIDTINILQASFKAMHKAIAALKFSPEFLLIDGNRFKPYATIPFRCVVQGDGTFANIAAASILAKTYRDKYMQQLHAEFPMYDWCNNKGYGTIAHRNAIKKHGLCKYHRHSFNIASQ